MNTTTRTAELTVTRNDEEVLVTITGDVTPIVPGRLYGRPEDCYPAEGGEVLNLVARMNGEAFELTSEEEEAAADLLAELEAAGSQDYDY
jgi:hypothetical protein